MAAPQNVALYKTNKTQTENELDTMLQDVGLAVQLGWAAQEDGDNEDAKSQGLEWRLMDTAEVVCSAGGNKGLLDTVKDFNAYLERALGVLA